MSEEQQNSIATVVEDVKVATQTLPAGAPRTITQKVDVASQISVQQWDGAEPEVP